MIPSDLLAALGAGLATILPYVGVGVAAAVVLMFAYMGIRKGFGFFFAISGRSARAESDMMTQHYSRNG